MIVVEKERLDIKLNVPSRNAGKTDRLVRY